MSTDTVLEPARVESSGKELGRLWGMGVVETRSVVAGGGAVVSGGDSGELRSRDSLEMVGCREGANVGATGAGDPGVI